jgi:transposase
LADRRRGHACSHGIHRGLHWKPIYNLLEGRFTLLLVNAKHVKHVPGRKTDVKDCQWLAKLLQAGLLKSSFIPERPQRELRDLTRHRSQLVGEKTRVANRIQKILEDANIKLAAVASLPGFDQRAAQNVIAEIGADMAPFPSEHHLSSWAGVCPGSNESGGKRKSGKTTKGNRWLRTALVQGAWAASRKKGSYFQAQYRRLAPRRGKKRAALAVAHSLLVVIFHMLKTGSSYKDLGGDYFDKLNQKRLVPYFLKRLTDLGYQVTLKAA